MTRYTSLSSSAIYTDIYDSSKINWIIKKLSTSQIQSVYHFLLCVVLLLKMEFLTGFRFRFLTSIWTQTQPIKI